MKKVILFSSIVAVCAGLLFVIFNTATNAMHEGVLHYQYGCNGGLLACYRQPSDCNQQSPNSNPNDSCFLMVHTDGEGNSNCSVINQYGGFVGGVKPDCSDFITNGGQYAEGKIVKFLKNTKIIKSCENDVFGTDRTTGDWPKCGDNVKRDHISSSNVVSTITYMVNCGGLSVGEKCTIDAIGQSCSAPQ